MLALTAGLLGAKEAAPLATMRGGGSGVAVAVGTGEGVGVAVAGAGGVGEGVAVAGGVVGGTGARVGRTGAAASAGWTWALARLGASCDADSTTAGPPKCRRTSGYQKLRPARKTSRISAIPASDRKT